MSGSRLVATGHYQPAKILTNDDLAELVDTSDEWISKRVGIRTRHVAEDGESVADLATHAAAKALAGSGLDASDIDLVLVATCTQTERAPNVASRVAARLGVPGGALMDLGASCSGFTHALVVGADKMTAVTDWTDRTTCVLTGDGAGAAVVSASEEARIGPVVWGSAPELGRAVRIEGTPTRFSQDGQTVYRWATTRLPAIARQACERGGVRPQDLAAVVLHQANLRIIEPIADKLGAVNAIVARDVVESGNTSAASVPLALSKLLERGEVPQGAPMLLFGFGGNLSYAGMVVRCP